MPKPKLIQFGSGEPEPPVQQQEPEVFTKKPTQPKVVKKSDLEVKVPEPEPEPTQSNEPQYEPEPVKPKKKISEKQRAHLARMRERKLAKAQGMVPDEPADQPPPQKPTAYKNVNTSQVQPQPSFDEDKDFERWLKNMDKFDKVVKARQEKERKRLEEEQRKEAEMEARIRKKIAEEEKQRMGVKQNVPPPTNSNPILQQPTENRFGEYSKMFGY